jgi:hypothetical protein
MAVATLKIGKAMFGTRVVLNGKVLGDHLPSFTPGYFDARDALKSGENELLVRVGAARGALPPSIPDGFDFEKTRYIPGIFDSVELILSGTPNILSLQTAPDLSNHTVRVQTRLHNAGPEVAATVHFTVRELKSGKVVASSSSQSVSILRNGEGTVEVQIPISNYRTWSPEAPFLYCIEADTGADHFKTQFGMRTFTFDQKTKTALLNGKPYFMRGSNVTLYRFFDDPQCSNLPWNSAWVRLLHRRVKEIHWNCLRYCIGDGTPTTLTETLYKNLLGTNSTTATRRHLYARYLAAESEFWRSHRQAAAVMHFTALGYSRPGGQTSDHWLNVAKLQWEPEFLKYVRGCLCANRVND